MKNLWLHRFAILVAVLVLIVIALGACLTSEIRPLPGTTTISTVSMPSLEAAHRVAGYAAAVLTLGLAVWYSSLSGWIALAAVAFEAVSGSHPIVHALFAPVLLTLVVAIAVLTSQSWQAGPNLIANPWGPVRSLGIAVPILVAMQIALGCAFRQNQMSVIWHILNAIVVLSAALVAGMAVFRGCPVHPSLCPAALALLIITGIQVLLGFAVYLVLLMSSENNSGLIVTSVLHVANGALTLAASVVLAMQMNRNLIQSSGV